MPSTPLVVSTNFSSPTRSTGAVRLLKEKAHHARMRKLRRVALKQRITNSIRKARTARDKIDDAGDSAEKTARRKREREQGQLEMYASDESDDRELGSAPRKIVRRNAARPKIPDFAGSREDWIDYAAGVEDFASAIGVLHVFKNEQPSYITDEQWDADVLALCAHVGGSLDKDSKVLIRSAKMGKTKDRFYRTWQILLKRWAVVTATQRWELMLKFVSFKMEVDEVDSDVIEKHMAEFKDLRRQLAGLKDPVLYAEDFAAVIFINTLPSSYNQLTTMLLMGKSMDFDEVCEKVRDWVADQTRKAVEDDSEKAFSMKLSGEEQALYAEFKSWKSKRGSGDRRGTARQASKRTPEEEKQREKDLADGTCFICHQSGHASFHCPQHRRFQVKPKPVAGGPSNTAKVARAFLLRTLDEDSTDEDEEEQVESARAAVTDGILRMTADSGASRTFIPTEVTLANERSCRTEVEAAFGKARRAKAKGTLNGSVKSSLGTPLPMSIGHAIKLPGLEDALLSIAQVVDASQTVVFTKEQSFMVPNEHIQIIHKAAETIPLHRVGNAFEMHLQMAEDRVSVAAKSAKAPSKRKRNVAVDSDDEDDSDWDFRHGGDCRSADLSSDGNITEEKQTDNEDVDDIVSSNTSGAAKRRKRRARDERKKESRRQYHNHCRHNKRLQGVLEEMLHRAWAHESHKRLAKLASGGRVHGFKYDARYKSCCKCTVCLATRATKAPFRRAARRRYAKPGELIHSDVKGPIKHSSRRKKRYMVVFVDDATRRGKQYYMRDKTEVLKYFKRFVAEECTPRGIVVKRLRSDRGSEYRNVPFQTWCRRTGIVQQYSAPHCQSQNGVAERYIREVMKGVRSILKDSGASKKFWCDAAETYSYLRNRLHSSKVGLELPEEMWTQERIDVTHIRHPPLTKCWSFEYGKKDSLADRRHPYLFLGYDVDGLSYRLLKDGTNTEFSRRYEDVVFEDPAVADALEAATRSPSRYSGGVHSKQRRSNKRTQRPGKLVGRAVRKWFDDGWFEGVISSWDGEYYHVYYEDDDEEDLEPNEVQAILIKGKPKVVAPTTKRIFAETALRIGCKEYAHNLTMGAVATPRGYKSALRSEQREGWKDAMDLEWKAVKKILKRRKLAEVRKQGHHIGRMLWMYKVKPDRLKARLCYDGSDDEPTTDTYAPVARMTSVRTLLCRATRRGQKILSYDISNAFTNAPADPDHPVYVYPPPGYENEGYCYELQYKLYGEKTAPLAWFNCFKNWIVDELRMESTDVDSCYFKGAGLELVLYVDDMFVTGKETALTNFERVLMERFKTRKESGDLFLGVHVEVSGSCITLHQRDYAEKVVKKFNVDPEESEVSTPGESGLHLPRMEGECEDKRLQSLYRSIVGSLMYLCVMTRVDLAFTVKELSRHLTHPTQTHLKAAMRAVKYVASSLDRGCVYDMSQESDMHVSVDADWAGEADTAKSTSGFIVFWHGGPLSWSSKTQTTVAHSSCEAEYVALDLAIRDLAYLLQLMKAIGEPVVLPVPVFEDNQSAVYLTKKCGNHARTKHLNVKYHYCRGCIRDGIISVIKISTENQTSDLLTKWLPVHLHERHVRRLQGSQSCAITGQLVED